jgi:hypothetical protein
MSEHFNRIHGIYRPIPRRHRPLDWAPVLIGVLTLAVVALCYGAAVVRWGL